MVVAEAKPARICVAGRTSERLNMTVVLAAIAVAGIMTVPFREMVNVPAVPAVFAAIISVMIVFVEAAPV